MSYAWDDINNVYRPPSFKVKKGSRLNITLQVDKKIDEISLKILEELFRFWTFPLDGKDMKPYKVSAFTMNEDTIQVSLTVLKKNDTIDELKLLCQDILDYLNSDSIQVVSWVTNQSDT